MLLHPSDRDPTRQADLVVRPPRTGLLVLGSVLWAVPGFWWAVGVPDLVVGLTAAPALLVTLPLLSTWRYRGRPSSWRVVVDRERIWINLRSPDHRYFASHASVLSVEHREIELVRTRREDRAVPDPDGGTTTRRRTGVELVLRKPVSADVRDALDEILREKLPSRAFLGITVTPRVTSFPVSIAGDRSLLVFGTGRRGAHAVVRALDGTLATGEEQRLRDPDADFESSLRALARGGDRIAAIRAAREELGLSAAEAVERVEALAGPSERPSG